MSKISPRFRLPIRSAILHATLFIGLLVSVGSAQAASRIFNLHLKNIDSQPVTFKLLTTGHNCYQGSPGLGQIFENVAPGQAVTITLARVQGHGCNGEQGQFEVEFTPGVGEHFTVQHFDFDNSGGLNRTAMVNSYPGTLSAKAADESYTYYTHKRPVVTASKAVGSWAFLCQGYCNDTVSKEITNTTTNEKSQSRETTQAISIALEGGVDFPGGAAKTTMTASQEKKVGHSMSQSISRGETNTKGKTIIFTPEQMRDLGIFSVWQWVASTQMSTGSQIIVTTDKISCSADGNPPTYLPGAREDIEACRGGLARARNQAAQQAQQLAAQQQAQQQAQQLAAQQRAAQQQGQVTSNNYVYRITVNGEQGYVTANDEVVTISAQNQIQLVGRKVSSPRADFQWVIQDNNNVSYYVDYQNQLWGYNPNQEWMVLGSVEVLDSTSSQQQGQVTSNNYVYRITVNGEQGYLTANDEVVTVSAQNQVQLVGRKIPFATENYQWAIQDDDNNTFYVDHNNQLWGYNSENVWAHMGRVDPI